MWLLVLCTVTEMLPSLVPLSTQLLKAELPMDSDVMLHTPKLEGSEELWFLLELETRVEKKTKPKVALGLSLVGFAFIR